MGTEEKSRTFIANVLRPTIQGMDEIKQTWQDRARRRMRELDLTQRELAKRCGVSTAAMSHYMNGRREPTLSQLQLIADELALDPAFMVFGYLDRDKVVRIARKIADMTEEDLKFAMSVLERTLNTKID
ncbi:helix-turn-helix domain-containing protein [Laribacter hongkongensis]|uniref:helix-turn-helix domain-containing protein n=1 Tax=Laribacter hongkongensis TaxID=168471 RepID=UPI0005525BC3|nr:helix-turn-helix transcriptional regulator [Laribacter hongkongensis]